jgi:uncharacterized damage-inducible protein DinB
LDTFIDDIQHEFRRHKALADRAMDALNDEQFFERPGPVVNPVALIVKHLAGNMASRWSDFLTTDGEKESRDRDAEFVLTDDDTRGALMTSWERGWSTLFQTIEGLSDADLRRTVTIRGEPHTVRQALLRGALHVAYHTGQILYLARWLRPDAPWLTMAPGTSRGFPGRYRQGS